MNIFVYCFQFVSKKSWKFCWLERCGYVSGFACKFERNLHKVSNETNKKHFFFHNSLILPFILLISSNESMAQLIMFSLEAHKHHSLTTRSVCIAISKLASSLRLSGPYYLDENFQLKYLFFDHLRQIFICCIPICSQKKFTCYQIAFISVLLWIGYEENFKWRRCAGARFGHFFRDNNAYSCVCIKVLSSTGRVSNVFWCVLLSFFTSTTPKYDVASLNAVWNAINLIQEMSLYIPGIEDNIFSSNTTVSVNVDFRKRIQSTRSHCDASKPNEQIGKLPDFFSQSRSEQNIETNLENYKEIYNNGIMALICNLFVACILFQMGNY